MRTGTLATLWASALALAPHAFAGCVLEKIAELHVTMSGGSPIVDGTINGVDARFFLDSGAFFSVLAKPRLGPYHLSLEPLPFGFRIFGVGGAETPKLTYAKDFTLTGLGNKPFHKVAFLVTDNAIGSDAVGLLGQNLLSIYDTEYDLANGIVRLMKPKDCKKVPLAYWHGESVFAEMSINRLSDEDPHLVGQAMLNEKKIDVLFDTGAPLSVLTEKAAKRSGVTRNSADTVSGGIMAGFGSHLIETWVAHFQQLDLGGERIRNARLRVGDFEVLNGVDMLLGVDFFLSHRIYVAASQHRIYFTYNGGRIFDLRAAAGTSAAAPPDPSMDAAAYRRRGAALATRSNFSAALADLDQAVKLDPADPQNYYSRGMVRWQNEQLDLAMDDLNAALRLKADDIRSLMARGQLHLASHDEAAARTDFDAALRLAPTDDDLGFRVANAYVEAEYFKEAIPELNRWMAANRKSNLMAWALNARCWARAAANVDLDGALDDCNKALKKTSDNSTMLDSRGLVWLRRADFDKAIADYQAVLKSQPGKVSALYGLGLAEMRKGMKEQGQRDIDAANAKSSDVAEMFKRYGLAP